MKDKIELDRSIRQATARDQELLTQLSIIVEPNGFITEAVLGYLYPDQEAIRITTRSEDDRTGEVSLRTINISCEGPLDKNIEFFRHELQQPSPVPPGGIASLNSRDGERKPLNSSVAVAASSAAASATN